MLSLKLLLARFYAPQTTQQRPGGANCFRPKLEVLEGRWTPTVLDTVNFTETVFVSDSSRLGLATGMAWAPDGSNRLFVLQRSGEVRIVENGAILATPFATVRPIAVGSGSENGLIGITFDHNYVSNRYVYLFVSITSSKSEVIRYTDNGNVGTDKTTLVSLPGSGRHTGGGLGVGSDDKLYWSIGDLGGPEGVDDDLTTLAAKVGRANLDGSPVADNPFNDNDGVVEPRDYIYARGFRNPFTLTFQEATGQLWVNTVGTAYEQIFKVNAGSHAGWDNYENTQPSVAPYITPTVVFRTNGGDRFTFATNGATRSGGISTFTTSTAHNLRVGSKVTISNVVNTSFNGTDLDILAVPSPTTFTVAQAGPDATSTGGRVDGNGQLAGEPMGGCVTGGAFYTSTAFPTAFRENFFFGDFNSGRVFRVSLDSNNNVTSINAFSKDIANIVDVTVGPDGALYYIGAGVDGVIRRTSYNTPQGIIVSPTVVNVSEGGAAGFSVSLATRPTGNVTINVARASGDADLGVESGAHLVFTPDNYATPQAVVLRAAHDEDTANDTATFSLSGPGLPSLTVGATAIDDDSQDLVVSISELQINEGANGSFTVALQTPPASNVTVTVSRLFGDSDITVQAGTVLVFTPQNYNAPQTVTIAAAEDADSVHDVATFAIQGQGGRRLVAVTAIDNDPAAPVITSTPITVAVVNAAYTYDVSASGNPAPSFSLVTGPAGLTIDQSTGVISWTPSSTGNFDVTVRAANGVQPDATQSFTITVNPDQPPTAVLSQPVSGATVSGANSEFFGTAFDDVGCVKAEFYIDGVLRYTDVNNQNHYHFGGGHLLWDTTQLSNGTHTLRFVVYDTAGRTGFAEVSVTVDNPFPPLGVADVKIGDGGTHRSVVRSLAVTFTGVVTPGVGAFELVKLGAGGGTVDLNVSAQVVSGRTVATLSFLTFTDADSNHSLSDGLYRLTVKGAAITDVTGRPIDADGDGYTGGDRVVSFHRLFGDSNGDQDVDNGDLFQFRTAFAPPANSPIFDFNGDGDVDNGDLFQFRTRFGMRL
jgi:glucose/arabinose dehydrogenase